MRPWRWRCGRSTSYAFSAWFASPFLCITSPTRRCGKTLLLIVLGALVPRRLLVSNVTPAMLFRAIEKFKPTLLIDEADTFIRENDELRGVLNSGHTRTTAIVIRAVGDDHDPRVFSTWCPKAIALIGKLPGTLADRSIEVPMRRRTSASTSSGCAKTKSTGSARPAPPCGALEREYLSQLEDCKPDVPKALHDRAADCRAPYWRCRRGRPILARDGSSRSSGAFRPAVRRRGRGDDVAHRHPYRLRG